MSIVAAVWRKLETRNDDGRQWSVARGVTLTRELS